MGIENVGARDFREEGIVHCGDKVAPNVNGETRLGVIDVEIFPS